MIFGIGNDVVEIERIKKFTRNLAIILQEEFLIQKSLRCLVIKKIISNF